MNGEQQHEGHDEIDINDEEEAALDKAWARLGYDASIGSLEFEADWSSIAGAVRAGDAPKEWLKYTRLSQLMATPEGREFWKTYGGSTSMTFDLAPGSDSMRTLAAYNAARGK